MYNMLFSKVSFGYITENGKCVFEIWSVAKCNYLSTNLKITYHQLKTWKQL